MVQNRYYHLIFRVFTIGIYCAGIAFLTPKTLHAQAQSPQKAIETFLATIHSMQFPIQDQSRHGQQVLEANAFLDLEAMGKAALGKHWDEATSEQQETFMNLLWQLIEHVAYARSHEFLGDFQITYPEIRPSGRGFEVQSVVQHQDEALNGKVIYHVYQENNQWKIDDVILDDVSLIEDMSYQFDKIIRDSSFSGLIERMQKRLQEAKQKNIETKDA